MSRSVRAAGAARGTEAETEAPVAWLKQCSLSPQERLSMYPWEVAAVSTMAGTTGAAVAAAEAGVPQMFDEGAHPSLTGWLWPEAAVVVVVVADSSARMPVPAVACLAKREDRPKAVKVEAVHKPPAELPHATRQPFANTLVHPALC